MNSSRLSALSSQESQKHTLLRWVKFNAVGGIGIVVQLAALAVFRSWLKVDYLLATGLAVEIAVLHNFLWHERFTWADRPAARRVQSLLRLAKFNASNGAVSIIGNLVLMRLLVGKLRFNYFASNLVAIVICSLLNFVLGDRFVFAAEAIPSANSPRSCRTARGLDRPYVIHSAKLKYACCQNCTSGHRCPARHYE